MPVLNHARLRPTNYMYKHARNLYQLPCMHEKN
jgi:hypothetical protein